MEQSIDRKKTVKKLLFQALSFFAVSGIGWIMDMIIYTIFTKIGIPVIIANIISSGIAVTYVYIVSTRKIFKNTGKYNLKVKYAIYILYQVCMILISSYMIYLISEMLDSNNIHLIINNVKIIAKILFTPVTMTVNFIFMKFLVEKIGNKGIN